MLTFALENELIETHPLIRFRMLREEPKAVRSLTIADERRLVEAIEEPTIASYVAILGETGLRKEEGLSLCWKHINLGDRLLSVEHTKSGRPRYVPLLDYAIEHLSTLVRLFDCPYVFVNLATGDRWRDPRIPFEAGKKKARLPWIGFHDLRRAIEPPNGSARGWISRPYRSCWAMPTSRRRCGTLISLQIMPSSRSAPYSVQNTKVGFGSGRKAGEKPVSGNDQRFRLKVSCYAEKRTRTSTGLPPLDPESSASANSAISAEPFNVATSVGEVNMTEAGLVSPNGARIVVSAPVLLLIIPGCATTEPWAANPAAGGA